MIGKLLTFIHRWQNRNVFCLVDLSRVRHETLDPIYRRGITVIPCHGISKPLIFIHVK